MWKLRTLGKDFANEEIKEINNYTEAKVPEIKRILAHERKITENFLKILFLIRKKRKDEKKWHATKEPFVVLNVSINWSIIDDCLAMTWLSLPVPW